MSEQDKIMLPAVMPIICYFGGPRKNELQSVRYYPNGIFGGWQCFDTVADAIAIAPDKVLLCRDSR